MADSFGDGKHSVRTRCSYSGNEYGVVARKRQISLDYVDIIHREWSTFILVGDRLSECGGRECLGEISAGWTWIA